MSRLILLFHKMRGMLRSETAREVGGVELAASMMTVRVEVAKMEKGGCGRL